MKYDFEAGEILLIDKPLHWTSFDVVNKVRIAISKKIHKRIKVGHCGTLDPLATGLLMICTGKMTKQIDSYQAQEKEYVAEIVIGKTTPSYDAETEFDQIMNTDHITTDAIYALLPRFQGKISQYPPIYSAIKQDGKKLYELARKGKEVELKPREIEIFKIEILDIQLPSIKMLIKCSKGTYIRSLAHDFGKALGVGAYLSQLSRTAIGNFRLEKSLSLTKFLHNLNQEEEKS